MSNCFTNITDYEFLLSFLITNCYGSCILVAAVNSCKLHMLTKAKGLSYATLSSISVFSIDLCFSLLLFPWALLAFVNSIYNI
jgi:hypothetical protein